MIYRTTFKQHNMTKVKIMSPVICTYLIILWLCFFTNDTTRILFSYIPHFKDMFGNILLHSSFDHISGNTGYALLLGPVVEQHYGSKTIFNMIIITTIVISLSYLVFLPNVSIIGFSGIVFMLIGASTISHIKNKCISLITLSSILFFGIREVKSALTTTDNIGHMAHILGLISGILLGLIFNYIDKTIKKQK